MLKLVLWLWVIFTRYSSRAYSKIDDILENSEKAIFKACVHYYFIKFLFFTKWQPFKNCEKCFLFHRNSSFRSRDIQIFVFLSSPVSHCFRGWSKKNLKIYVVISCLNKNLMTHFVWYLEKKIRCDIETYGKIM